ncbi:MAG: peptide chain release factor 2 [Myxococcota bacterium]
MSQDYADLRRDIRERMDSLRGIFDVPALTARITELEEMAGFPDFWSDQERSTRLMREKASLERRKKSYTDIASAFEEAETLLEMGHEENDVPTIQEAGTSFEAIIPQLREAEIQRLFSGEADENNAILEINSGAGGIDASDWADMLKRMYLQWASDKGYKVDIVDEQANTDGGIKSCTMEIKGIYAYGYLRAESGVHRLVRISPFDANSRRHTAFASVQATPEIDDNIEIDINPADLRIDTMRASGAGGQHVNTTDSAVRITHIPSGVVIRCQAERSQHKNKDRAMKMLRARLYQLELNKRQEAAASQHAERKSIEWGSQIRSYVLHPYQMVKDVRTEHSSGNTDAVLGGDLTPFMEAYLAQQAGLTGKGTGEAAH